MKKTGTKNKKRRPKGTGSIYYVASRKRYAGQTQVDLGGGKTKTKTVYGKTKTEVADKLKELERQSIRGEYIEKDKTVFYDFAEMLFNEQLELNEVRQSTYDRKMATLKMLSAISDYEIQDMDEKMIKDFFIKNLYYSQSSIDKMYQLLSFVFKKAVSKKIILESPMRDFKRPKSKQEQIPVRALTIDEQAALLKVLKENDILYSDIMLLAVFTGMRIGECCALVALYRLKTSTSTRRLSASTRRFQEVFLAERQLTNQKRSPASEHCTSTMKSYSFFVKLSVIRKAACCSRAAITS